jgi:integrase
VLQVVRPLALMRDGKPDSAAPVFPGSRRAKPLSPAVLLQMLRRLKSDGATTHGFRSSFSDWAAERTNHPREVVEMALAHAIESRVEAAYRRQDLLAKRRALMDAWARFCDGPVGGEVVPLHATR